MFDALYFSLLVLAVSSLGVFMQPDSKFAKVLLMANVLVVCFNVYMLQDGVTELQENQKSTEDIKISS